MEKRIYGAAFPEEVEQQAAVGGATVGHGNSELTMFIRTIKWNVNFGHPQSPQ